MKASFKAFMTGLIDYAGLFPPAKLDLAPALKNYADYLGGDDAWMLGRFIIPAARLKELSPVDDFRYGVILTGPDDVANAAAFKGRVEVLETRFPGGASSPERYAAHLLSLKSALMKAGLEGMELFAETAEHLDAVKGIASFNKAFQNDANLKRVGFKLRCGGLEKEAFPSPEKVAAVIAACREHDVALKCTAGLHHPVRRRSIEVDTLQHGFFNVFGAALLAQNLSRDEIEACLRDEDAESFRFNEEGFSWKGRTLPAGDVERFRRDFAVSFGSCSFDEPREDLRSLGWLE
jgi:hypothetical protein